MEFSEKVKKELTEILVTYASGNAEIVRTYFSRPRSREQDLSWLKCQAARELTTAWKFLDNLKGLQPKFEKELKRSDYENLARAFIEELEHYRLFVAILEEEFHEKIDVDELLTLGVWSDNDRFPENTKKAHFERQLRASGDELAKIALGNGPIHIAAAARRIKTGEQLEHVKGILAQYLRYHLRMKNEQFGSPLSTERLEEIDRGKVEPLEGVDFSPIDREREDLAAYSL